MKTILIATDGSEHAGQALDVAIDLARQTGATLQVLSVRPQRPAGRAGAGPAMLEVEELDGPEHIAEAAALRAREVGVAATPHSGHGDVVNVISDAAIFAPAVVVRHVFTVCVPGVKPVRLAYRR